MRRLLMVALSASLLAGAAQAQTFAETTDAGKTLATAADTTLGVPGAALTAITGAFGTGNDADLYYIYISDPANFSASTIGGTILDTALSLFTKGGTGLATNDDEPSGQTFQSLLPKGNGFYANLQAGYYYLGITGSGNEAVNSANQLIFATYTNGDTTSVRGAASGLNPATMSTYNGLTSYSETGSYRISLTGVSKAPAGAVAAVPEPASWVLMLAGVGLLGLTLRRRSRNVICRSSAFAA